MKTFAACILLFSASAVRAQQELEFGGLADQKKVDEAIKRGIGFLRRSGSPGGHGKAKNSDGLILLTLLHADVPTKDPHLQKYLKKVLDAELERTYQVALRAMCLEELDRVKYQKHIANCAQFLVDNQCENGQWSYGGPTEFIKDPSVATGIVPRKGPGTSGLKDFTSTGASSGRRVKPPVKRKIHVKKRKSGPARGDNSNSQYAALGLRACYDAGVRVSETVISRARSWWVRNQHTGPGDEPKRPGIATGGSGVPRGWSYRESGKHKPYGSMTAGAVSAVVIYDHILHRNWKRDKTVKDGMAWLEKNYTVTKNPGPCQHGGHPKKFLGYYLYAFERVGMLYGTVKFGSHFWYLDGAEWLLSKQRGDGAWSVSHHSGKKGNPNPVWDTCFAILFLKRATRPLVESKDESR